MSLDHTKLIFRPDTQRSVITTRPIISLPLNLPWFEFQEIFLALTARCFLTRLGALLEHWLSWPIYAGIGKRQTYSTTSSNGLVDYIHAAKSNNRRITTSPAFPLRERASLGITFEFWDERQWLTTVGRDTMIDRWSNVYVNESV